MPRGIATILGSGTSHGVPMVGVQYSEEFLSEPKNHRTRSSIHLQIGSKSILVDCSPELRIQVTREGIYDVDAVIITHTHADHIMGMDDLRAYSQKMSEPLPIYTLEQHFSTIRTVFSYAFKEPPPGLVYPRFDLHPVEGPTEIAGIPFQFFTVDHGSMKVLAFRIGNFGYMTDVKHVPEEGYAIMKGVETLVVDGLRPRIHPTHFNFGEAISFGDQVGAKTSYLTHLTHDVDHFVTERTLSDQVHLAYDGLQIAFESPEMVL